MQTLKFDLEKSERLDKFLSHEAGQFSRTQWQRAVKDGFILVNDKQVRTNHKLTDGDKIDILQEPQVTVRELPKIDIEIVYECPDYIIVNKPSGITVHPDNNYKTDTLIQQLVTKYPKIQNIDLDSDRPGVVHRLDKDVSGIMVVARTSEMFEYLKEQFKNRKVYKEYISLVHGNFNRKNGEITANIERNKESGKMLVRPSNQTGKESITKYEVMEQYSHFSLLKVAIKTGRTHQIRVVMQSLDHPIVGDSIYNKKKSKANIDIARLFLHASKLAFALPNGKKVEYNKDLPETLQTILNSMQTTNKATGKIIVISGTTASGKTTVVEKFLEKTTLPFTRIITSTTRKKRKDEKNGIDYNFLSEKEFTKAIEKNKFLEWAKVHNYHYGSPKKAVAAELANGNNVILVIDVQGALDVKDQIPEAILIFIKTENFEQIRDRIIKRQGGVPQDLDTRLESAKKELALADQYNYQIVNKKEKIDESVEELNEVLNRELL